MRAENYDPGKIEPKWQKKWLKSGLYSPDINKAKNPFYNLWMFPYPSAEGLHAGHAFSSTGGDIYGRFMRMSGYDVFQPIGYDSFGIHSENFAIKINQTPQAMLAQTTKYYEAQLKSLGHGYDWTRTVTTSDVDYYRWTQWLFVQLFKAGLAYKKKAAVNWCPSCKTVLADEQIIDGRCERCQTETGKRELEQWFFKITDYADRLLAGLEKIDWSQRVVVAQRNWIGKKSGMKIKFDDIEVFTTRPDTLEGATFVAVPGVGRFTGRYVTNPLTKKKIPVWEANYVAPEYGSGAIMGVPAHDARDREFATKCGIEIVEMEPDPSLWEKIEAEGWGAKAVSYHLRDWLISRQRYWGPPIPMIYCPKCAQDGRSWFSQNKPAVRQDQTDWDHAGWYPEENLPVKLPTISDYQPEGAGKGPLANHPEFYKVACPECGAAARRETDVSDTFLDSSWYFLRYPSTRSGQVPFDEEITRKWLPVSLYFGGAEHAVLHLMYARFVTMVLYDLKLIDFEEPFPRFYAHGLMIKDGAKMSKSRGNVVNPDGYIAKHGADTLRLYLMFMGPMDGSPDFRDTGIEGMRRFVNRLWALFSQKDPGLDSEADRREVLVGMHQAIKRVTEDIKQFKYNTAIAAIMEFVNLLVEKAKGARKGRGKIKCAEWEEAQRVLVLLLVPFVPHLAEEVWESWQRGGSASVHVQEWPQYDEALLSRDKVTVVVEVDGRVRERLDLPAGRQGDREYVEQSALKSAKVAKYLGGAKYRAFFVPGKIINLVTRK